MTWFCPIVRRRKKREWFCPSGESPPPSASPSILIYRPRCAFDAFVLQEQIFSMIFCFVFCFLFLFFPPANFSAVSPLFYVVVFKLFYFCNSPFVVLFFFGFFINFYLLFEGISPYITEEKNSCLISPFPSPHFFLAVVVVFVVFVVDVVLLFQPSFFVLVLFFFPFFPLFSFMFLFFPDAAFLSLSLRPCSCSASPLPPFFFLFFFLDAFFFLLLLRARMRLLRAIFHLMSPNNDIRPA